MAQTQTQTQTPSLQTQTTTTPKIKKRVIFKRNKTPEEKAKKTATFQESIDIKNEVLEEELTKIAEEILKEEEHAKGYDEDTADEEEDQDFPSLCESYTLQNYKNGLLLTNDEKDCYMGNVFSEGWWNKSLNGYVFKKDKKEELIRDGAKFIETNPKEIEMNELQTKKIYKKKVRDRTYKLEKKNKKILAQIENLKKQLNENKKEIKKLTPSIKTKTVKPKKEKPKVKKYSVDEKSVADELKEILEDHLPPIKGWVQGNIKEVYLNVEDKFKTLKEAHDYYKETLKAKIDKNDNKYVGIVKTSSGYILKPNTHKHGLQQFNPKNPNTPANIKASYLGKWIIWRFDVKCLE